MRLSFVKVLALALAVLPLCAQLDVGIITGKVTDSSGAVVVGADVTVTQTAMNFETVFKTNADGLYRAPDLRSGPYRITVAAPGFKKLVRADVTLVANQTAEIDATLEVGAATESVEVAANAQMLETETAATGTAVNGDYFYSLPNFQRNIKSSAFYTPGLQYSGLAYTGNMNNFHLDGLNTADIGVFEDGALATVGDGMTSDTIENTIDEIKVLTTALPAEYGHSAGGAISVVKKSGTNQIHGIASEYGRTRRMQERKFFDQYENSQLQPGWTHAPGLISENPDANLSGPVYIPHIYDGRNKTFFLFGVQRYIEKQSKQQVSTVPNAAELGGDFSFGGIGQTIYDPSTTSVDSSGNWHRNAFPNNIIPQSQIDKVAAKIMSFNPYLPANAPGSISSTGPSNNLYTAPMKLVFWENYSARIDQQFTPSVKAYATVTYNSRYQRQPPWTIVAGSLFDSTNNASGGGTNNYQTTWGAGTSWVASPTLVNDLRASYYRYNNPNIPNANIGQVNSILGLSGLPAQCMAQIWPGGFTESLNLGCGSSSLQEIITLKDDVSKVHGNHAFKFGYELLRYREDNHSPNSNTDGSYSYQGTGGLNANGTSISNTGNTFAGFLTGEMSGDSFAVNLHSTLPRIWQNSWYAQDDWKISSKLTANIGLRYNIETPVQDKYGLISVFNPTAPDTSIYTNGYVCNGCVGAWQHPYGSAPYNTQYNRFDPRFGLAWHPLEKVVVRTGFGLSHIDMRFYGAQTNELGSKSVSLSEPSGSHIPLFQLQNGIPAYTYPAARPDGSIPYSGGVNGWSGNIIDKNIKDPYTMNWNLTVEYSVSKDYLLTLQYQGSAQDQILSSWNANTLPWGIIPNPTGGGTINLNLPANAAYRTTWLNNPSVSLPWNNLSNVTISGNDGHRDHHEGTVKIEKRYSHGLNFLAFFTYGKTMQWTPGTLPGSSTVNGPYVNWGLEKAVQGSSQPMTFTGTMSYDLPFGKNKKFMNVGGWRNLLLGGYRLVWTYSIAAGGPLGVSISGSPYSSQQYPNSMPNYGNVLLLQDPKMRSDWQDLGTNRFNSNWENSVWQCGTDNSWVANWGNSCMVVKQPFSLGNDNAAADYTQRIIAATASMAKDIPLKERLTLQLRLDYQNPFKWYNWGAPTTALNISTGEAGILNKGFGQVSAGNEGTTAVYGGAPLMNATIAVRW